MAGPGEPVQTLTRFFIVLNLLSFYENKFVKSHDHSYFAVLHAACCNIVTIYNRQRILQQMKIIMEF